MSTVTIDGRSLNFLESGRGEPVLLIHGLGSSSAQWAPQIATLEKAFRVIAPDLPGCGSSAALRDGYSIEKMAASLWSLLDRLTVRCVSIIGFSLGGAVALEMALQRPEAARKLVLINSLATYQRGRWNRWLERLGPAILMPLLGTRNAARLAARRLFPEPWQRATRDGAAAVMGSIPAMIYFSMGLALQRWSAVDRLHQVMSHTLIIAGENDFVSLAGKHQLAAKLGADIAIIRGSRHGTPLDSVAATNALLTARLADQPLPPSDQWIWDAPVPDPGGRERIEAAAATAMA